MIQNRKMNTLFDIDSCKPILRWAGGKKWLIKYLQNLLPINGYNMYHEPFLGGASILCALHPKKAFVYDLNEELINLYEQLTIDSDKVIDILLTLNNDENTYYKIREKEYKLNHERAARFMYLNATSYNGIWRVNSKGKYNVPYGRRSKFEYNVENIKAFGKMMEKYQIKNSDFYVSLSNIKKGDLVFLDPPYTVVHNLNGFVKYNQKIFDQESQIRLSNYIDEVQEREAYYILTNAAHSWIESLFKRDENKIFRLNRYSSVGGANAKRGNFEEFVITNI